MRKPANKSEGAPAVAVQRMVVPTREMKLKAISDIRAWSSEYSHVKDGQYSDMVEERAEASADSESWRKAYEWVDDILIREQTKLRRHNAELRHAAPDARNATDGQCGVA